MKAIAIITVAALLSLLPLEAIPKTDASAGIAGDPSSPGRRQGPAETLFHLETDLSFENCDFQAELRAALGRLGEGFRTVATDEPASVTFILRVERVKGHRYVNVELQRPDGILELSRRLSNRSVACAPLADAISLIIERYLEDIGWRSSDKGLLPPAEESPPPAQEEAVQTPPSWRQFGVSLNMHGSLDGNLRGWFGPELGAYGRFGNFDMSLLIGGHFWRRYSVTFQDENVGKATLFSSYGILAMGACLTVHGRLCFRGAVGLEQVYGHSTGELIDEAGWEVAWQFLVRADAIYIFENVGKIRPYIGLSADLRPFRAGFEIDQADQVFRTSLIAGTVSLGFRWYIL